MTDDPNTTATWNEMRGSVEAAYERTHPIVEILEEAPVTDDRSTQTAELVPIAESDVRREAGWLRRDGHTFAASLMEALWAMVSGEPREEGGISESEDVRLALQNSSDDETATDSERSLARRALAEIRRLS